MHRFPMFGFALLGFLFIGFILAIAVWLAFRSGKDGTTKLGAAAGCMIALALVFVAGLGALGCTAIAIVNTPGEMLRHGPIRRIEAHFPRLHKDHEDSADEAPRSPGSEEDEAKEAGAEHLHLRIEMEGGDATQVSRWFRDHTDGDMTVSVRDLAGPGGKRTRIDITLPVPEKDLRELRRDFERDLPGLNLPDGLTIELKGEDD